MELETITLPAPPPIAPAYALEALVADLFAGRRTPGELAVVLPDPAAAALVERLKAEADQHWWINANRSLELAGLIVQLGRARGDQRQVALGLMARGDALKLLGQTEEAWQTLGEAGELFRAAGDEVGWARTRIGRLVICVELNRVREARDDAARARAIFTRHGVREKRLVLDFNLAIVHDLLGEHRLALELFHAALRTAEGLGEQGAAWRGQLFTSIGNAHDLLGDFRQAAAYHERARAVFATRNEPRALAIAELNLAHIAMAQGNYRQALQLLHHAYDLLVAEDMQLDAAHTSRHMVECYLHLNRYAEARELAERTVAAYAGFGAAYHRALALLELAVAEAELGHFAAARTALDTAAPLFADLGAEGLLATVRLRRARIALRLDDPATADREAALAAEVFGAGGQQVAHATALLACAEAALALGDHRRARLLGRQALAIARSCNVPALRYGAHLLLGRVAEAQGRLPRAARRYQAAVATVDRVQQSLTITLRPGFLERRGEAQRALIGLYLRTGRVVQAFESLERAKSQLLLGYMANRHQLRWATDDPRSRALLAELAHLREEHQWFYHRAYAEPAGDEAPSAVTPAQAAAEVAVRERRMRAITEQLYLHSGGATRRRGDLPSLRTIQGRLAADELLIEFYNDGEQLWAFAVDHRALATYRLPITVAALDQLSAQLGMHLAAALNLGELETPAGLNALGRRILQRLYTALLGPLEAWMHGRRRLLLVPYGGLHALPLHLLDDGTGHLIERFEVVNLPAAGLVTHKTAPRRGGALVLAHSRGGQLPLVEAEAQAVAALFGGTLYRDDQASRAALQAPPVQILHIAAHGEHRLDQPEHSYIDLADGQLYTDDLLQQDLSYELVTLSACETGRANLAPGDELIGLGRGFLYAGAGALIVSLWRVPDALTATLMGHLYTALHAGASKAAALRTAQLAVRAAQPRLHPAFWGAFQLVGNADPLGG